jgi:hypothetical protein
MPIQQGMNQQTPAAQRTIAVVMNSRRSSRSGGKRRRKSTAKRAAGRSTKRKGRKLKFGSPAWRKKYMKK